MAEQHYDLMHKDDVVASLQLDNLSGAVLKVTPGTNPELLPLGGRLGADSLRKWWLRRAVPISQGGIAALLQRERIPSTQSLLVRNLGLSLSDHYWIKPSGSELTWKDVSPFSNAFSSLSEAASAHSYSPDAALQGDLIKKWLIVDDTRCLLKGNRGANSQQSLNEVLHPCCMKSRALQTMCGIARSNSPAAQASSTAVSARISRRRCWSLFR